MRRRADASLGLLRALPDAVSSSGGAAASRLSSLAGFLGAAYAPQPRRRSTGRSARIAASEWLDFDLAEMKEVKEGLGGTLNDVVLATVAGAIRRHLTQHGASCDGEFRALIPVSTRAVDERGNGGNPGVGVDRAAAARRVAAARALRCDLPAHVGVPRQSRGARRRGPHRDRGVDDRAAARGGGARLISKSKAFNVIVTNVPGPPVPFYLLDAPMVAGYPHVPLFENQGLGIALLSYAGRFSYGLVGEWDLLPDIERLAAAIEAAYAELREAAGVAAPAPARKLRRVAAA